MGQALLIIDLQQEFFKEGRLKDHRQKLATNVNELVDIAHKNNIPVIWVRQEYKPNLSDAPLYNRRNNKPVTIIGTEGCQLLPELHKKAGDYEIIKKRFSAFFKTDLEKIIQQLHINSLIIAGVNTMTCIRTTAIDAYQRDYDVILALDCIDAYDIKQHKDSLKYLQYAVALGRSNKELLKLYDCN